MPPLPGFAVSDHQGVGQAAFPVAGGRGNGGRLCPLTPALTRAEPLHLSRQQREPPAPPPGPLGSLLHPWALHTLRGPVTGCPPPGWEEPPRQCPRVPLVGQRAHGLRRKPRIGGGGWGLRGSGPHRPRAAPGRQRASTLRPPPCSTVSLRRQSLCQRRPVPGGQRLRGVRVPGGLHGQRLRDR